MSDEEWTWELSSTAEDDLDGLSPGDDGDDRVEDRAPGCSLSLHGRRWTAMQNRRHLPIRVHLSILLSGIEPIPCGGTSLRI